MNEDQKCLVNETWSNEAGTCEGNLLAQIIRHKNGRIKATQESDNLYWNIDLKCRDLDQMETNATAFSDLSFIIYPESKKPRATCAKVIMPRESRN